jgi:hypothetical protein
MELVMVKTGGRAMDEGEPLYYRDRPHALYMVKQQQQGMYCAATRSSNLQKSHRFPTHEQFMEYAQLMRELLMATGKTKF